MNFKDKIEAFFVWLGMVAMGWLSKNPVPLPDAPKFSPEIIKWGRAIQLHEGWTTGSRSFRNHNPGNVRKGSYSDGLGATGVDPQNFLIFPDYETGFAALCQFLVNACSGKYPKYDPNKGLNAFFGVYSPSWDGNDSTKYASIVAYTLGISPELPIKDLL